MAPNPLSIIFVIIATIINSIVFGYVASNTKNNKTNKAYLIFLLFIILYTIFDCIVIHITNTLETKDIIVLSVIQFNMKIPSQRRPLFVPATRNCF